MQRHRGRHRHRHRKGHRHRHRHRHRHPTLEGTCARKILTNLYNNHNDSEYTTLKLITLPLYFKTLLYEKFVDSAM